MQHSKVIALGILMRYSVLKQFRLEIWYSTFTKIELILLHVEEQFFEQQQKLTFFWGTVIAPLICKHVK